MVYTGARYSTLPAGQSPEADLENVLDNLFYHPNVGPFIGKQLIQRLVTSNPSPAYVARVARKFNDNGGGVRGDMKAVVRAILIDDEARNLTTARQPTFGKLTEPLITGSSSMFRAFKGKRRRLRLRSDLGTPDRLGQDPLAAPSVFNFYRPEYTPGRAAGAGRAWSDPSSRSPTTASIADYAGFISCVLPFYGWPQHVLAVRRERHELDHAGSQRTTLGLARSTRRSWSTNWTWCSARACLDPTVKAQIVQTVGNVNFAGTTFWGFDVAHERLYVALWLIMNSPDYLVQK